MNPYSNHQTKLAAHRLWESQPTSYQLTHPEPLVTETAQGEEK